ncbi:MAG: membrane protein insertase YidC [Rickettsiales bacterium]
MHHHAPHELRNMLIAVGLSVAIMLAWGYFFPAGKDGVTPGGGFAKNEAEQRREAAVSPKKTPLKPAPRLKFDSEAASGSISAKGFRLDDVYLKDYDESANRPQDGKVRLLHPDKETFFVESGLIAGRGHSVQLPGRHALWTVEGNEKLAPNKPAILTWEKDGVKVRRTVAMKNRYAFVVTDAVTNDTASPFAFSVYGATERVVHEEREKKKQQMLVHSGMIAVKDARLETMGFDDVKDVGKAESPGVVGWTGMTDQYWLAAVVPDQSKRADIELRYFADRDGFPRAQAGAISEEITVAPGETREYSMTLYAGAKELATLDKVKDDTGAALFDRAIDFGWVYFLSKPMLKLLEWLRGVTGNMGLAIIALTVVVRTLLFPLANKSFVGMRRLKELHPQLEEIRLRMKHDPLKMNQEVMKLYQKEKVNPMTSGCLPIFLQFPVFFALYKVLLTSIEMRYAPFYGWITNLSAPDPTNIFTAFGLLAWYPPAFLHVGALPTVLGVTMFLQQKLAPPANDETQRKIMSMLPLIFTFFMASFPAGLVLYWTMSNSLSILQQYVMLRRFNAKRTPAAK